MSTPRVITALLVGALAAGCTESSPTSPSGSGSTSLTPARNLEGFWTTPFPVMFIYQTDFCGPRQNVARALWNVSWTIEAVEGDRVVLCI